MTADATPLFTSFHLPPRAERDWVTSAELVAEAGVTYRRVDYWTRTGLLSALPHPANGSRRLYDGLVSTPETPGSGHLRRYSVDQVARACILRDLLAAGLSLQTCRLIADRIVAGEQVTLGRITLTYSPGGDT